MRIRLWVSTLLPALALCAMGIRQAQAQGDKQTSDSQIGDASSSAKEKTPNPAKNDSLRELENQIFRSFKAPPPKGPLSEPSAESPRSAPNPAQSKRAKELQDRKDWIFMEPEQLMAVPTVEDLMKLSPLEKKDQSKEKLSPLESYFDRLYHPDDPTRKKDTYGEMDPFGALKKKDRKKDKDQESESFYESSENADQSESDLPDGVRQTQRHLKRKLSETGQNFGVVSSPHKSFLSDIFGLDVKAKELPTPLELEAQKQRMEQFKALYGFQAAPPSIADPNNALSGLVQFSPSVAKTPAPVSTAPSLPANSLLSPQPPGFAPLPDPGALPDVAKFTIAPPTLFSPALPKTEQRGMAPMPNFNAPRRPF